MQTFADFIRLRRIALGLTQDQVAARLPVTGSAVGKWERGVAAPTVQDLPAIAEALELTLPELLVALAGPEAPEQRDAPAVEPVAEPEEVIDAEPTDPGPPSATSPFVFEGQPVRVELRDGEPLWVATDVCAALGLAGDAGQHVRRLDEDERTLIESQGRQLWALTEPGLYTLIVRSNSRLARPFRRWVTHEVLPAIRRRGTYSVRVEPSGTVIPFDFERLNARLEAAVVRSMETFAIGLTTSFESALTAQAHSMTSLVGATVGAVARTMRGDVEKVGARAEEIDQRVELVAANVDELAENVIDISARLANTPREHELFASGLARRHHWYSTTGRAHSRAVSAIAQARGFVTRGLMVPRVHVDEEGRNYQTLVFTPEGAAAFAALAEDLTGEVTFTVGDKDYVVRVGEQYARRASGGEA